MPHGNTGTPGTAENTAMFFMEFQHIVFGDTSFVITDSTLFANPSWPAWGSGKRKVRFRQTISGGKTGRSADQVIQCTDIYWCGSPWASECIPDCDYLYCQYGICYLVDQQCECIMNCGGSGGDPYGDPPPGGGGTGGGGGTPPPPECIPIASRMASAVPGECPPGWIPPNDDPPPPPLPAEPIDSILNRFSRSIKDTAVYIYDNLSKPNNIEYAFTGIWYDNNIKVFERTTENDSLNVRPKLMIGNITILFIWHSHVSASSDTSERSTFSPADIDMLRHVRCLKNTFVSFADCRNKRYALVITDVVKATTFFNNHDYDQIESLWVTSDSSGQYRI